MAVLLGGRAAELIVFGHLPRNPVDRGENVSIRASVPEHGIRLPSRNLPRRTSLPWRSKAARD